MGRESRWLLERTSPAGPSSAVVWENRTAPDGHTTRLSSTEEPLRKSRLIVSLPKYIDRRHYVPNRHRRAVLRSESEVVQVDARWKIFT